MQKIIQVVLVCSVLFNIGLLIAIFTRQTPVKLETKNQIDTIIIKRDSIKEQIDTIITKIHDNEQMYLEKRNVIINNSALDDYLFFSEYIRLYDSIESANKNSKSDICRAREVERGESTFEQAGTIAKH